MTNYEVVAFYQEDEREIAEIAKKICECYGLLLRLEKVPPVARTISVFLGPDCVFCMFCRETYRFYRLMKYVYASDKPVLIIQKNISLPFYKALKVPVGYLQESKEKVVWANFLQHRHPDSRIELLVPHEKDDNIAAMVHNNVVFMENILKNSGVGYTVVDSGKSYEKTWIQLFRQNEPGVVFMMRPFRIFAFYIPYLMRIYRKYASLPVLIIPRDEALYIPCH